MKLVHLFSLGGASIFFVLILVSKNPRRFYLLFVLYVFPIMDLAITPESLGRLRLFDVVSYMSFILLLKDFLYIKKGFTLYNILFFLFVFCIILGSLNSLYIKNSLLGILSIFPVFIYSKLLITECSEDPEFKTKIIGVIKTVGLFSIAFLAMQLLFGLQVTVYPQLNRNTAIEEGVLRYPSFFHDPQLYAQYLVLIGFLFLANQERFIKTGQIAGAKIKTTFFLIRTLVKNPAFKNYLLFLMVIVALLQTGGRSALMAIMAGALFLFVIFGSHYKIVMTGISIVALSVVLIFSDSLMILERVAHIDDDYAFRAMLWDEAYTIFTNYPLLGIGLNNFKNFNKTYSNNYTIDYQEYDVIFFGYGQPESGYLMILTELGLIGFIITFLFFLIPIFTSVASFITGNRNIFIFLIIAGILGWLTTFISAYSLFDKRILIIVITFLCVLIIESQTIVKRNEIKLN